MNTKVSNMGKLLTIYKAPKNRLAYVYKRKSSLRFYIKSDLYESLNISNKVYNVCAGEKETSFYVDKSNITEILDIFCKLCKGV